MPSCTAWRPAFAPLADCHLCVPPAGCLTVHGCSLPGTSAHPAPADPLQVTANYAARQQGVGKLVNVAEARRRCPSIVLVR